MRVAVVDVGSNTARLLVADVAADGTIERVDERRAYLGLGAEIASAGRLSPATLEATAEVCRGYAKRARRLGVERGQTIVTAPGRQDAAPGALVSALSRATRLPVRILSAEQEGRLAYDGAIACTVAALPEVVAVVDVGGGSTEIVVGTPLLGAAWLSSVDLGSLRLTRRSLRNDPPRRCEIDEARDGVESAFAGIVPPAPDVALATGGSARAVAKIVGRTFDVGDLDAAVSILTRRSSQKVARDFGIHPLRAGTVLAGALLLSETARLLDRPFELARGGLRDGAVLALATAPVAAAA